MTDAPDIGHASPHLAVYARNDMTEGQYTPVGIEQRVGVHGRKGGKGGGAGTTPREEPDSLRSKSIARVIDLLGEGEIGGLINGAKSIYLDGTPLVDESGNENFKGVIWAQVVGTPTQQVLMGTEGVETATQVNAEVKTDLPRTFDVTDPEVDSVRVRMRYPQLAEIDDEGNVIGSSASIKISVQNYLGSFIEVVADTVTGKTTSGFEKTYRFPLEKGKSPWSVKVERTSPDSTSSKKQNATWISDYTEIIEEKIQYSHSACVAMQIDSEYINGRIPTRSYEVCGRLIEVPSNYNPTTRVYTGIWNGTWTAGQRTSNPAYIFRDLLINKRFGLGMDPSQIDAATIYTIGKYCDELVPNGAGGTEPRFQMNGVINSRAEAYAVLNTLAGAFRSMIYWATGAVTMAQDSPRQIDMIVTPANVEGGSFNYEGTGLKARHTAIIVGWNNPKTEYETDYVLVVDDEGIQKYGWRELQVRAILCTSRGQATRLGRWLLDTEKYGTDIVTYRAGLDHAGVMPGMIVGVADPAYAGTRQGGRVVSMTASRTAVTLDAPVKLIGGETYTLSIVMPDGSVETKNVDGVPAAPHEVETSSLTVTSAFSALPVRAAVWLLAGTDGPRMFRVISNKELEGHRYEITGAFHDNAKFSRVDNGTAYVEKDYSILPNIWSALLAPEIGTPTESLYKIGGVVHTRASVSWNPVRDSRLAGYRIDLTGPGINTLRYETTQPSYDFDDLPPGTYTWKVRAFTYDGRESPVSTVSATLQGKMLPPSDVGGLSATTMASGVLLQWNDIPDLDADRYEIRVGDDTSTWATATPIAVLYANRITLPPIAIGAYRYFVKAVDTSGNYSENAAYVDAPIIATTLKNDGLTYSGDQALIDWSVLIAGSFPPVAYEVRYGASFAGGTFVAKVDATKYPVTVNWGGERIFWVAPVDVAGNVGTAISFSVTPAIPGTPTITAQNIDNNLLLKWTATPGSLPIREYEIRRGADFNSATVLGVTDASFAVYFETTAGLYTYWVRAKDSAGQWSSPGFAQITVAAPSDYVLVTSVNSIFDGTLSNAFIDELGRVVLPANTTETWADHFTNNSWTTPQNQIDAGYPVYLQPVPTPGYYQEDTIDLGTTIDAALITLDITEDTPVNTPARTVTISYSPDNSSWTNVTGLSTLGTSFRYVKFKIEYAATGSNDIAYLKAARLTIDLKLITDAGMGTANSGDTGGTTINFNKSFRDVQSITVTPLGTTARYAVYDFTDTPNPTSFKVLLFDNDGNRVSGDFSWAARGV